MPVSGGRYDPSMGQTSAAGFGSADPGLTKVQRKCSATRKVLVAGSIIGLITMMIRIIFTTYELLTVNLRGGEHPELAPLAFLMMIVVPFVAGLGWIVIFILGLITRIQANSRTSQVQPDGWIEVKLPTLILPVASFVAGLPILAIYVAWFSEGSSEPAVTSLLVARDLVEVVIAVGFVFLLRMSKVLDPMARAPQTQGMQPA